MATTGRFFYKVDGSGKPVNVEVKIFGDPASIIVNLGQNQKGNLTADHFPLTPIGTNKELRDSDDALSILINIIEEFDPNASIEVILSGGTKDRVIDKPIVIPSDGSTLFVFFIIFI